MTEVAKKLPEFRKPPVIEVVCGVTFSELHGFLLPHFGLLWERFKTDYPHCREAAPLAFTVERFDDQPNTSISLDLPLPRTWFVHRDETGIVQVQRDRFLHNWKKVKDSDEYPRYSTVISLFRERLRVFESFIEEQGIGSVEPVQYEMTYVNHIPFKNTPASASDVGEVFPDFHWRIGSGRFLPPPENYTWRTSFVLPEEGGGRLHASIRTARRTKDQAPLIVLDLTARGMPKDTGQESMWIWFDLAHEWIVKGFVDLTSDKMQQSWERRK